MFKPLVSRLALQILVQYDHAHHGNDHKRSQPNAGHPDQQAVAALGDQPSQIRDPASSIFANHPIDPQFYNYKLQILQSKVE
jgi:hypothetical protein